MFMHLAFANLYETICVLHNIKFKNFYWLYTFVRETLTRRFILDVRQLFTALIADIEC